MLGGVEFGEQRPAFLGKLGTGLLGPVDQRDQPRQSQFVKPLEIGGKRHIARREPRGGQFRHPGLGLKVHHCADEFGGLECLTRDDRAQLRGQGLAEQLAQRIGGGCVCLRAHDTGHSQRRQRACHHLSSRSRCTSRCTH